MDSSESNILPIYVTPEKNIIGGIELLVEKLCRMTAAKGGLSCLNNEVHAILISGGRSDRV